MAAIDDATIRERQDRIGIGPYPDVAALNDIIVDLLFGTGRAVVLCPNCGRLHVENKFGNPADGEFITYVKEKQNPAA
jgi:hypothetical protein